MYREFYELLNIKQMPIKFKFPVSLFKLGVYFYLTLANSLALKRTTF